MASLRQPRTASAPAGFTIVELLVVVALIGLLMAILMPNLGVLVPGARLDGEAKELQGQLASIRSEARIQAKRMGLELDLDKARYRIVYPPEEQLTSDQVVLRDEDYRDDQLDWIDLETNVVFLGAGDARDGLSTKGLYKVEFDEYGFSADQVIALQLESDDQMVWTLSIRGLSGTVEIVKSEEGEVFEPERVDEGAF